MILVDTSIWIDHFRDADPKLTALLSDNAVLAHSFVIGELALGSIAKRADVLRHLSNLPASSIATHEEVMTFIEVRKLANSGIGYVDAHLLASTALTAGAALWTRDKTLRGVAARVGVGMK